MAMDIYFTRSFYLGGGPCARMDGMEIEGSIARCFRTLMYRRMETNRMMGVRGVCMPLLLSLSVLMSLC